MALFSAFNNKQQKSSLTPELAFKVSTAITIFVNGEFLDSIGNGREPDITVLTPYLAPVLRFAAENEELEALLTESFGYIEEKEIFSGSGFNVEALNEFLESAASVLNAEQKLSILINVGDLLLSDGVAEEDEQELFQMFLDCFGISEDEFQPYLHTIMLKHDRSLF